MIETVFFAWQSDLPSEVGRKFIRQAIDEAVKQVNASLGSIEALRPTEGTQDVAGDVNVADTIFSKIDSCRIFVADVTTVTPRDAKRPAPNPNVLVEYGRASVRPGSDKVVTVFNTAFGDWRTERPFDLRHRRQPVVYNLPKDHSSEQRAAIQLRLVSDLAAVFKMILAAPGPLVEEVNISDFDELRSLYFKARFRDTQPSRTPGFWCGVLPAGPMPKIADPWLHQELVHRERSLNCQVGRDPFQFKTIDFQMWMQQEDIFKPRQRGASRLHRFKYPKDQRREVWFEDTIELHLVDNGALALVTRTGNVEPAPHLNIQWIVADVANVLRSLSRVRRHLGKPLAPYSMLIEVRYDQQLGDVVTALSNAQWRLCSIDDETGQHGWMMSSDPLQIGPLEIGTEDGFPEVLHQVYVQLITAAGRMPEEIKFELALPRE